MNKTRTSGNTQRQIIVHADFHNEIMTSLSLSDSLFVIHVSPKFNTRPRPEVEWGTTRTRINPGLSHVRAFQRRIRGVPLYFILHTRYMLLHGLYGSWKSSTTCHHEFSSFAQSPFLYIPTKYDTLKISPNSPDYTQNPFRQSGPTTIIRQ